ncbi:hypothetical protein BGZ63DRAFT_409264 [Mariannaea sp. PMI_226]|nr:hypothetical protein BGZ63DRAFT_409264 [Mariannaea sp. PMI_226]
MNTYPSIPPPCSCLASKKKPHWRAPPEGRAKLYDILSAMFSGDGQRIAPGSHDGTGKIWHETNDDHQQSLEAGECDADMFDPLNNTCLFTDNGHPIKLDPSSAINKPSPGATSDGIIHSGYDMAVTESGL